MVVRLLPLKRTTDPATKLLPVAVRMKTGPPAEALEGAIVDNVGTGTLTESLMAFELPPPGFGFTTLTLNEPLDTMSAAVITAVS